MNDLFAPAMALSTACDDFVGATERYRDSKLAEGAISLIRPYIQDAPSRNTRAGAKELIEVIHDFDNTVQLPLMSSLGTVKFQAQAASNIADLTVLQRAFEALEWQSIGPERAREYLNGLSTDDQVGLVTTARTCQLIAEATEMADSSTQLVSQREEALSVYIREHTDDFKPLQRVKRTIWGDVTIEAFLEGVGTLVQVGLPIAAVALGVTVPPLSLLIVPGVIGVAASVGLKIHNELSEQGQNEHLYGQAEYMLLLLDPLKAANENADQIVAQLDVHSGALTMLREGHLT